ncbi:YetF domain-containing protein [Chelativorans sp. Marseille-P2723]|uniref:DUF421 domain-containing protein n=1 Tax=Chelativorans sp. Marseille-P2723 TaxID=2709133 RepID=UPI00156DE2C5|nr:YetF domain-containing protein [Chelativorans sp. Marseille-P2723]
MIDTWWTVLRAVLEQFNSILGFDRELSDVNSAQMALRAALTYTLALLLVRIGSKRFLSQATAFDVIIAIMLGSILSRAINGTAPFLPTILASAALVGLHWLFAALAVNTSFFGPLVKGERRLLIEDGKVLEDQMRAANLSENDLKQALHAQSLRDPSRVKRAYLERDGSISVIPLEREPRILDVAAEEGMHTIRIKIE